RDPAHRFSTAREMALAIEAEVPVANTTRVAEWVEALAGETLRQRATVVGEVEGFSTPAALSGRPPSNARSEEETKSALAPPDAARPRADASPADGRRKPGAALGVLGAVAAGALLLLESPFAGAPVAPPAPSSSATAVALRPKLPAR